MSYVDNAKKFYARNRVLSLAGAGALVLILLLIIVLPIVLKKAPAATPPAVANDYFGPTLPNVFYKTKAFTGMAPGGRYYAVLADISKDSTGTYVDGTTLPGKHYIMWFGRDASFGTRAEAAAMVTTPYNATTAIKMYELHTDSVLNEYTSIMPITLA